MGKVQLLADDVINKIAAGEVVERPASVVKELVENALDAGAKKVVVTLEQGGTQLIAVTDDGSGMEPEDARLALRRHATSKIRSVADLLRVASMGFRGEALASIAAVSRFSLATRTEGGQGIKLLVEGGGGVEERAHTGPRGTTVVVEDLFFNVPARLKFLKAKATEAAHCLELMQAFALCYPSVSFTLVYGGRESLSVAALPEDLSEEERLRRRTADVLGAEDVKDLLFVKGESRFGSIVALVSPPGVEKASSKAIHTFLNRRLVRDKVLRYGILRGYHSHLLKGRFPVAIAHVTVDPSLVDVNVHPAKTEVRFQYPRELQDLMAGAIRQALRQGAWAEAPRPAPMPSPSVPEMPILPPRAAPQKSASVFGSMSVARFDGKRESSATSWRPAAAAKPVFDKAGLDALLGAETTPLPLDLPEEERLGDSPNVPWRDLEFLGAFGRCYLFFADDERLLVVDQHAFHERVLYERLQRDEKLLSQTQRLLVPEAVELAPSEAATLAARREELSSRGFELAFPDGGESGTVEVLAVPSLLAGRDPAALLRDLAAPEDAEECPESNGSLARLILATIACHAAVRAGEELGEGELKFLLSEAETVDFFHNCPHGRRVLRWWTKDQVARWFDR